MFGAVAELTIIDGKQAEFEAVAKELEAAVAANEPGVLYYKLFKVKDAPTTYIFIRQLSMHTVASSTSSAWARRWVRSSLPRRRSRAWTRCSSHGSRIHH